MAVLVEIVVELLYGLFEGLFHLCGGTSRRRWLRASVGFALLVGLVVAFVWWRNR
jgi:hypothetical protein